jgi:hypothetical protein
MGDTMGIDAPLPEHGALEHLHSANQLTITVAPLASSIE